MGKTAVNSNKSNDYQTLGKTPICTIAHCLERIVSGQKCYTLENSSFQELGHAANDAFLVEGILHVKNPQRRSMKGISIFHVVPKMNYVKEVKGDSEVEHISVLLYVPSIEDFFTKCHCQNPKT